MCFIRHISLHFIMKSQRKKAKTIQSEAREIIRTAIFACGEEVQQRKFSHSAKQADLRTSHYTGISNSTITRIRREGADAGETSLSTPEKHRKRPEEINVNLNDFDKRYLRYY